MSGLELLSDLGFRYDGRKPPEIRRLECRMGVFDHADGSSYVEFGNTKVIACVYGPHQISRNKRNEAPLGKALINCLLTMATFSLGEHRKRTRNRMTAEISMNLRHAFEATILREDFRHSQIDIYIELLQGDGGIYSACINAGTLALVDAGIPIRDLVCGCAAGLINEVPVVDLNHLEESLGRSELNIAILPKTQSIVLQEMTSVMHIDHFAKVLDCAIKGCLDVQPILESVIMEHCRQKVNDF